MRHTNIPIISPLCVRYPVLLPNRSKKMPKRQKNTYENQKRLAGGDNEKYSETIMHPINAQLTPSFFITDIIRFVLCIRPSIKKI